jgi:hypothetical protein
MGPPLAYPASPRQVAPLPSDPELEPRGKKRKLPRFLGGGGGGGGSSGICVGTNATSRGSTNDDKGSGTNGTKRVLPQFLRSGVRPSLVDSPSHFSALAFPGEIVYVLHEAECEKKALELLGGLLPDRNGAKMSLAGQGENQAPPLGPAPPTLDDPAPTDASTHVVTIGLDLEWKTTFEVLLPILPTRV